MTSEDRSEPDPDSFSALTSAVSRRALTDLDAARVRVPTRLPASWSQGRATFGGLQAGLALAGLTARVAAGPDGRERTLRSLQVTFVGPANGAATLELERLRHGRSASLARAQLLVRGNDQAEGHAGDLVDDHGTIAMTLDACFAARRSSAVEIASVSRPAMAGPDGLVRLPYIEGVTPGFTRYVELCWATGGLPGSGLADAGSCSGWVRTHEPFAGPPCVWLPTLIDAWPVPALQSFSRPVPASSLSWGVDLVGLDALEPDASSDQWWAYAAQTERASGGWVHTRARLWAPSGVLVATSRQAVALYG